MIRPKIICMTATKNEQWIMRLFLSVMSQVADHIIVADQMSTDQTRKICSEFDKVILVDNKSTEFNEPERQALCINEARKRFPGPKLLLAFDADDIPSANILYDDEWKSLIKAKPGVPIMLQNICLYNSPFEYRTDQVNMKGTSYLNWAVMDGGQEHLGRKIHSPRLPYNLLAEPIKLKNVVSMHYQFVDLARAMAKTRWYVCYERVNFPQKLTEDIVRDYRWVLNDVHGWRSQPVPKQWWLGWEKTEIDPNHYEKGQYFWWTWDVLKMFNQHGISTFADLPIWNYDWESARQDGIKLGIKGLPREPINDRIKRLRTEKIIMPSCSVKPAQNLAEPLKRKTVIFSDELPPKRSSASQAAYCLTNDLPRSNCIVVSNSNYSLYQGLEDLQNQCLGKRWLLIPNRSYQLGFIAPPRSLFRWQPIAGVCSGINLIQTYLHKTRRLIAVMKKEQAMQLIINRLDWRNALIAFTVCRLFRIPCYEILVDQAQPHWRFAKPLFINIKKISKE